VHAWLKSCAITTSVAATAIRAEIFALPHAVSENARIGQLTPDLLTPGFWLLAPFLPYGVRFTKAETSSLAIPRFVPPNF
jgi:hypothetical protein